MENELLAEGYSKEDYMKYALRVKVKKLRGTDVKLPYKASDGSACFDLYYYGPSNSVTLEEGETKKFETGLAFEIPEGYEMQIRPRSSLSSIGISTAFGTVDSDYRGEVSVVLINTSDWPRIINIGDRIAQCSIKKVEPVFFEQVSTLSETKRGTGGFGSTGR